LPHDLIKASQGEDKSSDATALTDLQAQHIVNMLPDRNGLLRGAGQLSTLLYGSSTPSTPLQFSTKIDGVGYLYQQPLTYSGPTAPQYPTPALLAVVTNGTLYTYLQNPTASPYAPLTYPPTFNVEASSMGGLIAGRRTRFVGFGPELYCFQDGNDYQNYRVQENGTLSNMGQPAGNTIPALTFTQPGTGPMNKIGIVGYTVTLLDSLGRESSPSSNLISVNYGGSLNFGAVLNASNAIAFDAQAVSANIYATIDDGTTYYLIGNVTAGSPTLQDTFLDTYVEVQPTAPHFGQNDPPLPASIGIVHKNRIFLNVQGTRTLQFSNEGSATQFNSAGILIDPTSGAVTNATDGVNTFQIGTNDADEIVGFASMGSVLLIFNRLGIYVLQGNDLTDFAIYPVSNVPCLSGDSIARCDNIACFLSIDGIYEIDGSLNTTKISQGIEADIFAMSATVSGITQMQASVGWYANKRYHIQMQTNNSTIYSWDFNNAANSRWFEFALNAQVNTVFVVTPIGSPQMTFIGRLDAVASEYSVQLFDTVTPNQTNYGMVWRTRAMQSNLPYRLRAAMGEQEPRAGRKRLHRVHVFGSGTLTAGSMTGSISATTLTISAVSSGQIFIGCMVTGNNITGQGTNPGAIVTAFGSGTGGAGTYTVDTSQSIGSEALVINGTITCTCDGRTEVYPLAVPSQQINPAYGILIWQEWQSSSGYLLDVQLNMSGTGIVTSDADLLYEFVG
jgi:hypothetical protein